MFIIILTLIGYRYILILKEISMWGNSQLLGLLLSKFWWFWYCDWCFGWSITSPYPIMDCFPWLVVFLNCFIFYYSLQRENNAICIMSIIHTYELSFILNILWIFFYFSSIFTSSHIINLIKFIFSPLFVRCLITYQHDAMQPICYFFGFRLKTTPIFINYTYTTWPVEECDTVKYYHSIMLIK